MIINLPQLKNETKCHYYYDDALCMKEGEYQGSDGDNCVQYFGGLYSVSQIGLTLSLQYIKLS